MKATAPRHARRTAAGAVAVALGLAGAAGLVASHPACADVSFDAEAAAYGFDATVANQTIPIGLVPEAAGPTAQAHLNSLPKGDAFASFPYPGDTLVGLPGLVGALVPGSPQLPAYPFYASASLGSSPADTNQPGIALHAEASSSEVQSKATTGTDAVGYVATANVTKGDDGSVSAKAETDFSGLTIGALAHLSAVRSLATGVLDTAGHATFASSLEIGRISIPGMRLTIPKQTPGSFPLPDPIPGLPQLPQPNFPSIPLPLGGTTLISPDIGFVDGQFTLSLPFFGSQKFVVPTSAVIAGLKALGLKATFESAQVTATSIVAPVLRLETVLPSPPANRYYSGPTDADVAIGRSTVTFGGITGAGPAATPDANVGTPATGFDKQSSTGALPAASSGTGGFPAPGGPLAAEGGHALPGQVSLGTTTSSAAHGPLQTDTRAMYLVLLVAGVIGALSTQVFRLLGVRKQWTS